MSSLILGLIGFFFRYTFAWLVCPWCGTWFPFWGRPEWGPRTPENKSWCKHCGRVI